MGTSQSRLFGGHLKQRLYELWIERRPQRNRLWEARTIDRGVAVQTLFVEDYRNAEAAVFQKEPLDVVRQFRRPARVKSFSSIARPPYLPQAVP